MEHYGIHDLPEEDRWVKVKCPFHGDSHASATVNPIQNGFKCFACGIQGDTYNIIMQHEGVEFLEAVKRAEEITGISSKSLRKKSATSGAVSGKPRAGLDRGGYVPPGRGTGSITRQ
jgi:DNA primase